MRAQDQKPGRQAPEVPARNPVAGLFNVLTSMKFALAIVFLIAIACGVGTLLPQGPEVADYLQNNPAATRRLEWLAALGLTDVFSCWWFLALLAVLAGNLLVCAARRLATLRNAAGPARRRIIGTVLVHLSLLVVFLGGGLRGIWAQRGFIELREGETTAFYAADLGRVQLPFAIQLVKFEIEKYPLPAVAGNAARDVYFETLVVTWPERNYRSVFDVQPGAELVVAPPRRPAGPPESFRVSIVRRVPDFMIDMPTREIKSRSNELRNPAIQVQVTGPAGVTERWLFARYPDFNMHTTNTAQRIPFDLQYEVMVNPAQKARIKSFKSSLRILEGQTVKAAKTIEVNAPLTYGGYTFYQSGYDEQDPTRTILQVVRDPSVPVVYLGFGLMTIALLITTWARAAGPDAPCNEKRRTP